MNVRGEGTTSTRGADDRLGPGRGSLRIALAGLALLALAASAGAVTYEERTDEAGIEFQLAGEVHPEDNSQEWPAFPEIMGSGACFADFDGDGYDDLYIVNQRYNAENPATEGWIDDLDPVNHLYLNRGDGTYAEDAAKRGVASDAFGYGCSAADYDADGDVDLYVTNFGPNELFENTGNGSFVNATGEAGVSGEARCPGHPCMSTSSAWTDYDADGDLDLYVGNYVDSSRTDTDRAPQGHDGQRNFLFRNDGDGSFTEVAQDAGVAGNPTDPQGSKTLGVVFFDADRDGDEDLYVANDEVPNDFYVNEGDGSFTERSTAALVADDRAGMGVTAGDYDADGDADLFFTHYASETNGFYESLDDDTFRDRSGEDEHDTSRQYVSWGTRWVDVDLDGDQDLVIANGHTEPGMKQYEQTTNAYRQDEDPGTPPEDAEWVNTTVTWGLNEVTNEVSRGAAFADHDYDGDTDVVLVNNANASAQLLEATGVDNHALTVRLLQPGDNPNAVGAQITVETADGVQHRWVRTGASYMSQSSLAQTFGLGTHDEVNRLTVTWPDGATTSFSDVGADQVVRVDRETGTLVRDTIAPSTGLAVSGTAGDNGWWTSSVEVTVDATDRGTTVVSGVASREIAPPDGDWRTEGTVELDTGGVHMVRHRATDEVGNRAPGEASPVRIDLDTPQAEHELEGTQGNQGWWTSDTVTVRLSGEDATSGLDRLRVKVDDEPWQVYEDPLVLAELGVHEVAYQAVDRAGRSGPVETVEVPIDHTPPEIEIEDPSRGDVYVGSQIQVKGLRGPAVLVLGPTEVTPSADTFRVRAGIEDPTSGITGANWMLDGTEQGPERAKAPFEWVWETKGIASGTYDVTVQARDVAGNAGNETVTVALASATEEGIASTVEDGPHLHAGAERLVPVPIPAV